MVRAVLEQQPPRSCGVNLGGQPVVRQSQRPPQRLAWTGPPKTGKRQARCQDTGRHIDQPGHKGRVPFGGCGNGETARRRPGQKGGFCLGTRDGPGIVVPRDHAGRRGIGPVTGQVNRRRQNPKIVENGKVSRQHQAAWQDLCMRLSLIKPA